ncbi:hypothetical protein MBANPS3_005410 [Mucor bainieri]
MSLAYVVTGASRGLGLEFANQLAAKGHTVIACARNPGSAAGLQKLLEHKNVHAITMDTTDVNSIKAAVEEMSDYAPHGIDVLINNAGIGGEKSTRPENLLDTDLTTLFQTNVVGVSNVTKELLPLLRLRGKDHVKKILNMSSIMGSIELVNQVTPKNGQPACSISKAALNMYTKMLANNLAKENFIVYASYPGWCATDLGGKNAPMKVKDSIVGQLAKLDSATAKDNGGFFDFRGKSLPW